MNLMDMPSLSHPTTPGIADAAAVCVEPRRTGREAVEGSTRHTLRVAIEDIAEDSTSVLG